jgi:hypothetical protein
MSDTYRPAARLREGMFLCRADGTWQKITSLVQITSPAKFAMVTLADGFEVSIPHTHEVNCRTAKEMERASAS